MSKKKKRNRRLVAAYRQELQAITSNGAATSSVSTHPSSPALLQTVSNENETLTPPAHWRKEIARTLVSVALMGVLLSIVTIFGHRTQYFADFGSWLYRFLRLNSV